MDINALTLEDQFPDLTYTQAWEIDMLLAATGQVLH
jgi:hypothetical protein